MYFRAVKASEIKQTKRKSVHEFLDKMERKYGRYALSHLTMYIIVTYIAGYIIQLAAPIMRQYLTLEPYYILHGQIWRLVSWILIPPSSLDIFTIIMLFSITQSEQALREPGEISSIMFTSFPAF